MLAQFTSAVLFLSNLQCIHPMGAYTSETADFNTTFDGWILSQQSWQRQSMLSLEPEYPTIREYLNSTNITQKEEENIVLIPYLPTPGSTEYVLSTMSKDIFLPEGGELEVLFSVYLMDWDLSNKGSSKPELGPSINPKLQVFYDEDLVFDISKAISEHQNHYKFNRWNQFKMLSEYREGINITITLVGSRGLHLDSISNTSTSLPVLIDNFNITTRRPAQSDKSFENKYGRLEPEAEVKEAGKWKSLQTEAEEEAENEEKELGRPAFCSLLPESTPCGRFPKKRYYFDAALGKCQEFMYEGCKGNENRFDDLETCKLICAKREHIEPLQISLRKTEFTSFESGFQGWNTRNWEKVSYEGKKNGFIVPTPPILHPDRSTNEIGISPVHRTFDFRLPEMTQEFLAEENAMLLIAFQLLVKGVSSSGLLSFFLRLDPGLEIYVGNVKVFDFVTQGVADEHWHEYQILMNKTEVYEHRVKSGDQNLLITIRGWLGTNGEGLLVVDNVNITQIPDLNSSNSSTITKDVNTTSLSTTQSPQTTTTTTSTSTSTSTSTTTTTHMMNDCSAQKEEGDCKGMFSRYYFNSRVRTCIQFFWSGCGGNSNRFLTEEGCKSSCISSRIDSSTPNQEFTVNNAEEVCAQPFEPGSSSCSQKLERFYFDVEVGSCVSFLFSGCEGNENNFLALSDCSQFCSNVTIKQIVEDEDHDKINIADCGLEYDPGTCTNYQPKYFYEPSSRSCQTFSYGGCGGNPNRFSTESECLSVCLKPSTTSDTPAFSPEVIPERRPVEPLGFNESSCVLPSDKGTCDRSIVRFYYNVLFENCFAFKWTGCGGNENNFPSWTDCWVNCQPEEEDGRNLETTISPTFDIEEATTKWMKDVMAAEDYSEEQDDLSFSPFVKSSDNTPEHVCSLKNDGGPCTPVDPTMFKTRFYHNKTTGSCEKFLYSGCGGNHNNFFNKSDCEAFCGTPKENAPEQTEKTKLHKELTIFVKHFNQSSCFISPRHGACNGELLRWYYSRWDNVCKPYNFTGCGGSANNFMSKSECEKNCPPVQISADESVCARLRERGHCVVGEGRFFYDKYSSRCIRFTACDDLGSSVNNFGSRDECKRTCIPKSLELNKDLNFTSTDSLTEEEEGSTPAASIVEALLVILVLGIGMFAGVLGWRHYKAKQGIEAYNLFGNERPSSETGTSDTRAGGRRNLTFENPVYTNDMYNVHRDADRNIQIPPLSLGNLGVIPELPETQNGSSFA